MSRLKTLGYDDLTKEQSDDVFRRFKVGQEAHTWDGGHISSALAEGGMSWAAPWKRGQCECPREQGDGVKL